VIIKVQCARNEKAIYLASEVLVEREFARGLFGFRFGLQLFLGLLPRRFLLPLFNPEKKGRGS
jgi:hypothetical protein